MEQQVKTPQLRQGDVLLEEFDGPLPEGVDIPLENGRMVLAHGEATGHVHSIAPMRGARFIETKEGRRFLSLPSPALLEHQEHTALAVPAGKVHEVVRQREYSPQAVRNVND